MHSYQLEKPFNGSGNVDPQKVYTARELARLLGFKLTSKFSQSVVCRKYFKKVSDFTEKPVTLFEELGSLKQTSGISEALERVLLEERARLMKMIEAIDTLLKPRI